MSSPPDSFQTKTSRLYQKLKEDVVAGRLKPGERLIRRTLMKDAGVSLSVVNEALARLEADGLAETREMYGTRVIDQSIENLRSDLELREAVERHIARLVATSASDRELERLLDLAKELDARMFGESKANVDVMNQHHQFHVALARLTRIQSLIDVIERTGIRRISIFSWTDTRSHPHPKDFHEQLVRVIMTKDPELAERKVRDHLNYGRESLEEFYRTKSNPDA